MNLVSNILLTEDIPKNSKISLDLEILYLFISISEITLKFKVDLKIVVVFKRVFVLTIIFLSFFMYLCISSHYMPFNSPLSLTPSPKTIT